MKISLWEERKNWVCEHNWMRKTISIISNFFGSCTWALIKRGFLFSLFYFSLSILLSSFERENIIYTCSLNTAFESWQKSFGHPSIPFIDRLSTFLREGSFWTMYFGLLAQNTCFPTGPCIIHCVFWTMYFELTEIIYFGLPNL